MRIQALLASAAALALATSALAAPIVDGALGDHAVLQRGRPIILTGKALPGETVSVRFAEGPKGLVVAEIRPGG